MAARATRTASIVASVPELTNRICSQPNRRLISSASATVCGVVTAKCAPEATAFDTASTIFGCA